LDPIDFIRVAEGLRAFEIGDLDEAFNRTAANRAYLGTVLFISDLLESRFGVVIPRSSKFYRELEGSLEGILDYRRLEQLMELRRLRICADYDWQIDFTDTDSHKALRLAKDLLQGISMKYQ
jgi:hypothetical protein